MSPVADGRKKEGSRLDGLGLFCGAYFLRLSKKTSNNRNISIISLLIVENLLSLHCQTTK